MKVYFTIYTDPREYGGFYIADLFGNVIDCQFGVFGSEPATIGILHAVIQTELVCAEDSAADHATTETPRS